MKELTEFLRIIDEAIEKARKTPCTLPEYRKGLKLMTVKLEKEIEYVGGGKDSRPI